MDVTAVAVQLFGTGHNYFRDNLTVLRDIGNVLSDVKDFQSSTVRELKLR